MKFSLSNLELYYFFTIFAPFLSKTLFVLNDSLLSYFNYMNNAKRDKVKETENKVKKEN